MNKGQERGREPKYSGYGSCTSGIIWNQALRSIVIVLLEYGGSACYWTNDRSGRLPTRPGTNAPDDTDSTGHSQLFNSNNVAIPGSWGKPKRGNDKWDGEDEKQVEGGAEFSELKEHTGRHAVCRRGKDNGVKAIKTQAKSIKKKEAALLGPISYSLLLAVATSNQVRSLHIVKIQLMYSAQTVGRAAVAPYGAEWEEKDGWVVVDTREQAEGRNC
ncbi:unnamed protein product [Pleuronectes platessa]|uniref:Uncharacterized protein n=1 Tax=Pleuronectes platessa TaxID=8262 RepID=A0A9N7U2M1_PLEPL|nr:unnamed protein product [Pleuronectes platessa]